MNAHAAHGDGMQRFPGKQCYSHGLLLADVWRSQAVQKRPVEAALYNVDSCNAPQSASGIMAVFLLKVKQVCEECSGGLLKIL